MLNWMSRKLSKVRATQAEKSLRRELAEAHQALADANEEIRRHKVSVAELQDQVKVLNGRVEFMTMSLATNLNMIDQINRTMGRSIVEDGE